MLKSAIYRLLRPSILWLVYLMFACECGAEEHPIEIRRAIIVPPTQTDFANRKAIVVSPAPPNLPSSPLRQGQPSLQVMQVTDRPNVDGQLDDLCWQRTPVIREFTQVDPHEGAAPTERTEMRVVQDSDYLYVAVRCFDREPEKIVAAQLQNDAPVKSDDTVSIVFDTFGQQRDGYMFILTPAGAKFDALIGPGGIKSEWDAIWEGGARIDSEGWVAEFAIPFKSLSFGPAGSPWGFNVERVIRRKQEVVRWASPFKNKTIESLADAGRLEGLSGIRKGIGIDFQPFLVGRYREQNDGGKDDGYHLEIGFDAFFHLAPSVTAAITVNTDFAETEVDERQVNLTRFPLFFPEKRDFFLQDAGIFSFGAGNSPLPFHSRRIGLGPTGETIDIIAGGKVTGRIGNTSFGLLDVQMADSDDIPEKNLAVARISQGFWGESDVGGIFTFGDPTSHADNYLIGTDVNFRNSHFMGNDVLTVHGWLMKTGSDNLSGNDLAFGGAVVYPNEPVRFDLYASQVDADFNPALGFVKRKGVREYGGSLRYRWRPDGWLRTVDMEAAPYLVVNLDGQVETELWTGPTLTLQNQAGDSLSLSWVNDREQLFVPFQIHPDVAIAPGDYTFSWVSGKFVSSPSRALGLTSTLSFGEFYDGTRAEYDVGMEWRVSPHLFLSAEVEYNDIELSGGNFDVIVASTRMNIAFTPRLFWNTVVQYDNVSETVGLNSRIRWIVQPGSDIFLVFNRGFAVEDGRFQTLNSEVAAKVGWTFRF